MKNYIERYIYDVTRRLPQEMQEDVKNELSSNIYDMLPNDPSEDDIDKVLHEIGSPRVIANNYKESKNYVISPLYYDDYIRVLKLVLIIVGAIAIVFGAIDSIIHVNEPSIFESIGYIVGRIIGDFISALIQVFFFVTVIFWIIDHKEIKFQKSEWKLKDLPDLPEPKTTKISKTNTMIGLVFHAIFSTIFIVFLLKYVPLSGWYEDGILIAPFFNENITNQFIVFFIISAIIGVVVHLFQLYEGQWKLKVAICYTAGSIISVTIGLLFINQPNLITYQFFLKLAETMEVSVAYLRNGLRNILIWVTVIVIVVTVIDLISIWLKTLRPKKISAKKE